MSSIFFYIGVAIIVVDIIAAFFIIFFVLRKKKEGASDPDHDKADRSVKKPKDTTGDIFWEKVNDDYLSEDDSPPHGVFPGDVGWDLAGDTGEKSSGKKSTGEKSTGKKSKEVNVRRSGLEDLGDSLYIFKSAEAVWVCPYCDAENPPENHRCSVCGES